MYCDKKTLFTSQKCYVKKRVKKIVRLTNANCSQKPDAFIWRVAEREERLGRIDREGQGDDGLRARPDNDALDPQTDEGQKLAKGHHDVGVVGSGLLDHAA